MQKADYLLRLMKQRTDALVATDEKLQQFLIWVKEKSLSVEVPYKPAVVRAFYFALDRGLDPALVPALERGLDQVLDSVLDFALERTLIPTLDFALDRALDHALIPVLDRPLNHALDRALEYALDPELRQALQQLKEQLPDPDGNKEILKQWWKANGQAWSRQLREMAISHRNIGHDWQFSNKQMNAREQYYNANRLLVDCLNSGCNVTPAVLQEIGETLLLPIAEIQKRSSC